MDLDNKDNLDSKIKQLDTARQSKGGLTMTDTRLALECVCQGKVFQIIVKPDLGSGAAQILTLLCLNPACHATVNVSDRGKVGDKAKLFVDVEGKKHHRMIAGTGYMYNSFKKPVNN